MVPPRAVKVPTLRRTSLNSGTVGACAGACANSQRLPSVPTNPSDDRTTNCVGGLQTSCTLSYFPTM